MSDVNLPPEEQADQSGPMVDPDDLIDAGRGEPDEEPLADPAAVPPPD